MAIQDPSKPVLKRFRISRRDFDDFKSLQLKPRSRWWAVFSVNPQEQVWPFVCYGHTPEKDRSYVPLERYPLLKATAGFIIEKTDHDGGRFFIDDIGVSCIKGEVEVRGTGPKQVIAWVPDEPLQRTKSHEELVTKRQEMMKSIKAKKAARRKGA